MDTAELARLERAEDALRSLRKRTLSKTHVDHILARASMNSSEVLWTITRRHGRREPIGFTSLFAIDLEAKRAGYHPFVRTAAAEVDDDGLVLEAVRSVLDYAASQLGLLQLTAIVPPKSNVVNALESSSFVQLRFPCPKSFGLPHHTVWAWRRS